MKFSFLFFTILTLTLPNISAVELPEMLKMRIDQMNMLQRGQVELSKSWPDDKSGLFQGVRKGVKSVILTKENHLNAIATIPKHLLKDRIIGETVESGGWFYTSIEHKDWKIKKASWFNVIASAKNSKVLCFSHTW